MITPEPQPKPNLLYAKGDQPSQQIIKPQQITVIKQGKRTLQDPNIELNYKQATILHPNKPQPSKVVTTSYGRDLSKIIPAGIAVRVNSNPISRYNFALEQWNQDCNRIQGVQLLMIPIICPVAYLYDFLIFFYTSFFLTITCQNQGSLLWTLLILALYVTILIAPYISIVQFLFSAIFFIFYAVGIAIYNINSKRLSPNTFQQNMIPCENVPFYDYSMNNDYFDLQTEQVRGLITQHPDWTRFQQLKVKKIGRFMAYHSDFITERYQYIVSARMIGFHITFMIFSIVGLVVSVSIFPVLYGRGTTTN